MIKQLKKYLKSQAETKDLQCTYEQVNHNPKFQLKYQDDTIGYLNFDGSIWTFSYSAWFINQDELQPLFEFPKKDKVYTSLELWPFFESRIPSKKQPKIQKYLESHPFDHDNKIKLLELFGITSVNNPYKLVINI